jgi:hypothetical protein
VVDLKWIEDGVNGATLHGPKGLWLHRAELYVVDVDTLRIFNRFTGAPIRDLPIPNPFAAPGPNPALGTPGALFLIRTCRFDTALLGSFQLRRTEAAIRRLRRGTLFRPIIRTSTSFRTESPCLYESNPWIRNSAGSCGCGHRTSPYCARTGC